MNRSLLSTFAGPPPPNLLKQQSRHAKVKCRAMSSDVNSPSVNPFAWLAPPLAAYIAGTVIAIRLEQKEIKQELHDIRQEIQALKEPSKQG